MTDTLADLNPVQREAVTTIHGSVLVLPGPSSGKTRVLTHRVAYVIRERDIEAYRLMAVTFTNKAALFLAGVNSSQVDCDFRCWDW